MTPPRLRLEGVTKRFGATLANDAVDLSLEPGGMHALLGENGAGKSTLVKIIYGMLRPDAGTIAWEGRRIAPKGPAEARSLGIAMVFQHFSLFESLTVLENVALGIGGARAGRELAARIGRLSRRYGLALDPDRPVLELTVGERQRVEIVRCLVQEPKLLIMDEPTSVLTPQEAGDLFATLRRIAAEGCAILYISHKLSEVIALCREATVLRAGRVVARVDLRDVDEAGLAELMVGRLDAPAVRPPAALGPARLEVDGLSLPAVRLGGVPLTDARFRLHGGEVLGIAGVAGNGQDILLAGLSGRLRSVRDNSVRMDGRPVGRMGPRARRRLGLSYVPEERIGQGAVRELPMSGNVTLSGYDRLNLILCGLIRPGAARRWAAETIDRFRVIASGPEAPAGTLSGGNLQKFIVGREVLQDPGVLIAAHPTWGIDAAAAQAVREALRALARAGAAVLVVSQDLDELMQLSDRIGAISGGRLSEFMPTAETDAATLGLMMSGDHVAP